MSGGAEDWGIDPAGGHPERQLAFGYAPAARRRSLEALFALDATLGRLTFGTRDAMTAQLRLAWWGEALAALDTSPPAQPILRALAEAPLDPRPLAGMIDGWQRVLAGDVDLAAFGRERGTLFAAAAAVLDGRDDIADAGAGWALADLARVTADRSLAAEAAAMARPLLARAAARRWSPQGRALGALVLSARADLAGRSRPGSPRRVARLAWHRLTGR